LFSLEKMPDAVIRYDYISASYVGLLFEVGQKEKAIEMATLMGQRADENAAYYFSQREFSNNDLAENIMILEALYLALYEYGESDLGKKLEDAYTKYLEQYRNRGVNSAAN
jgi:hypothetical protein